MACKKGQKRRFWSDDEKRSICGQARESGVSVAQVAPRYSMNTNLIHKRLRDPRFTPDCDGECPPSDEASYFPPIEIEDAMPALTHPDIQVSAPASTGANSARRVDITLSDGRRILVEDTTSLSAALALVEGLIP
jgi:transposase